MDRKIISSIFLISFFSMFGQHGYAQSGKPDQYQESMTSKYSQKSLLKNWAFSACLAKISTDQNARSDANATASAYLEYGHQSIEAYEPLRNLAEKFAGRKYGGSINSEFNTMKCIDLFNS